VLTSESLVVEYKHIFAGLLSLLRSLLVLIQHLDFLVVVRVGAVGTEVSPKQKPSEEKRGPNALEEASDPRRQALLARIYFSVCSFLLFWVVTTLCGQRILLSNFVDGDFEFKSDALS
jgi:hypothetical protein